MPPDFSLCAGTDRTCRREATTIPPKTAIAAVLLDFINDPPWNGFARLRRWVHTAGEGLRLPIARSRFVIDFLVFLSMMTRPPRIYCCWLVTHDCKTFHL